MSRWKKRVRTSVLTWRGLDSPGHIGELAIDYIHDGRIRSRHYLPRVNLTTGVAEAGR